MWKIRLDDGTELDARYCSGKNGVLTAGILSDLSFIEIAELFNDADKTQEISFIYGEMHDDYSGYTKLVLVNGVTPGEYIILLED